MEKSILKKLIEKGILICGRKYEEDGIVRFERIDASKIEEIPEEQRGYATLSMGRAIFTIDKDGKVHNYKGVDSNLRVDELGPAELLGAKTVEYLQGKRKIYCKCYCI